MKVYRGIFLKYFFEWDPEKARSNRRKHRLTFEEAASVFLDPRAMSLFDMDHSGEEDRWITLGFSSNGMLIVVHHTFAEMEEDCVRVRLFSARKASRHEQQQYVEKT